MHAVGSFPSAGTSEATGVSRTGVQTATPETSGITQNMQAVDQRPVVGTFASAGTSEATGVSLTGVQTATPEASGMGAGSMAVVAVLGTVLLCCGIGCCLLCKFFGCLFSGAEDAFDGDGEVGGVAIPEEAMLAGAAGYKLAGLV